MTVSLDSLQQSEKCFLTQTQAAVQDDLFLGFKIFMQFLFSWLLLCKGCVVTVMQNKYHGKTQKINWFTYTDDDTNVFNLVLLIEYVSCQYTSIGQARYRLFLFNLVKNA